MISTVVSRTAARRTNAFRSVAARRWQSAATPEKAAEPEPQIQLANIALAASLLGFCGFVFTYSMNAVGKADAGDPLSQLQAEAQEAKNARDQTQARRLSADEVAALESGMTRREGDIEVAVAAPADVAQMEEEANLRLFRNGNGEEPAKTKKPRWRFGF